MILFEPLDLAITIHAGHFTGSVHKNLAAVYNKILIRLKKRTRSH